MKRGKKDGSASPKLIIDLGKMGAQGPVGVKCSYRHHPENRGFAALLERVCFSLICRRCEAAPCVAACPRSALEKVPAPEGSDGRAVLKRANMLCTGCGTCSLACPFGTVYDDLMPFASSVCDLCRGRLAPDEKPLCVRTCEDGSLDYGPVEADDDLIEVLDGIVVRVPQGSVWKPILEEEQEVAK